MSTYTGPLNSLVGGGETVLSLYGYTPNRGFNIFAAVVWGVLLAAHVWWLVAKKTRAIQGLIVLGCALELIGYSIRAYTHNNPFLYNYFSTQYVLIHTAPIFFIMALVNAIGWAMRGNDNASVYQRYKPRTLTGVLQAFNTIIAILLIIGSAMYARALSYASGGSGITSLSYNGESTRRLLIAAHALKIASLLAILGLLTHLLIHFNREGLSTVSGTHHSAHGGAIPGSANVDLNPTASNVTNATAVDHRPADAHTGRALSRPFLAISWLTAGMLLTRTAYRLAETARGPFSRSWSSEALFGVFEFAVTWTAVAIWAARPFATQMAPAGIVHTAPGMSKTRV